MRKCRRPRKEDLKKMVFDALRDKGWMDTENVLSQMPNVKNVAVPASVR